MNAACLVNIHPKGYLSELYGKNLLVSIKSIFSTTKKIGFYFMAMSSGFLDNKKSINHPGLFSGLIQKCGAFHLRRSSFLVFKINNLNN